MQKELKANACPKHGEDTEQPLINGYTQEEAKELARECQERYENLEVELVKKALTGEIGTNAMMIKALKKLNYEYQSEMADYVDCMVYREDLNPQLIELFEDAELRGRNVMFCAANHLRMLGIWKGLKSRLAWKNEDGQVCDERGVPLSSDGEHRVFEAIKGGRR